MNTFRKLIALFIIVFIAVPTLVGVIFAVGATRAVVSEDFMTTVPREIIEKFPALLDEAIEEINHGSVDMDENSRIWMKDVAEAKTTPRELMEKIGVMAWLKTELTQSFNEMSRVIKGETRPHRIMLNMRPLKTALQSPEVDKYIREILEKLPPCTSEKLEAWSAVNPNQREILRNLPPCRPPDIDMAVAVLRSNLDHEIAEMPNEVDLMRNDGDFFRHSVDIGQIMNTVSFLLFFFPAILLFIAVLIASSTAVGRLRWMGVSVMVSGFISFAISHSLFKVFGWGFNNFWDDSYSSHIPGMEDVFVNKFGDLFTTVIQYIFSSIEMVAGVVFVIGIIFFALSYYVRQPKRPASTTTQPPSAPSSPSTPSTPSTPTTPDVPSTPSTPTNTSSLQTPVLEPSASAPAIPAEPQPQPLPSAEVPAIEEPKPDTENK